MFISTETRPQFLAISFQNNQFLAIVLQHYFGALICFHVIFSEVFTYVIQLIFFTFLSMFFHVVHFPLAFSFAVLSPSFSGCIVLSVYSGGISLPVLLFVLLYLKLFNFHYSSSIFTSLAFFLSGFAQQLICWKYLSLFSFLLFHCFPILCSTSLLIACH